MTDAELAVYLKVPVSEVAKLAPRERRGYERLALTELGINLWLAGHRAVALRHIRAAARRHHLRCEKSAEASTMTNEQRTVIREGTIKSNLKDPPTTPRPPPPKAQVAGPSSNPKLRRMSPFVNGTAYCGMLLENPEKPQHFGPDLADGCGPYYESRDVDAEIERLTAERNECNELYIAEGLKRRELSAELDRLRAALRDYGQHQQRACLDLPATETQFCYCGLTAALAEQPGETPLFQFGVGPGQIRKQSIPLSEGVIKVEGSNGTSNCLMRVTVDVLRPATNVPGCAPGPNLNIKVEEL